MRRREFISLFGGAVAAWPVVSRAQPAMPVIGLLGATSGETDSDYLRVFRQALRETGHVEGENVAIAYRWAENQLDRLPALAADLVGRKVAVIAAVHGPPVVLAAKAATATIPIVFTVSEDPVALGLVASLARPGGNLTGINFISAELVQKRLELLRELVPATTRVAVLVNPANTLQTESTLRDVEAAARAMGLQIQVLNASTNREIDAAFATLERERPDALFVASGAYFTSRRVQLAQLAARYAIPAAYVGRQFVDVGGLMSYGANLNKSQDREGPWRRSARQAARARQRGDRIAAFLLQCVWSQLAQASQANTSRECQLSANCGSSRTASAAAQWLSVRVVCASGMIASSKVL